MVELKNREVGNELIELANKKTDKAYEHIWKMRIAGVVGFSSFFFNPLVGFSILCLEAKRQSKLADSYLEDSRQLISQASKLFHSSSK